MKFELKNIKHSAFASQETHCYQATLYIDGKAFFLVGNDGHGGSDYIHATGKKGWKSVEPMFKKVMAHIKAMPKIKTDWGEMDNDLDFICHDLLVRHLESKKLKRKLKKECIFLHDKVFYGLKTNGHAMEKVVDHIELKYPKAIILNTMPESKALDLWLKHA